MYGITVYRINYFCEMLKSKGTPGQDMRGKHGARPNCQKMSVNLSWISLTAFLATGVITLGDIIPNAITCHPN